MASLIAIRVRRPDETLRQAKDKVRKRLVYAVEHGELTLIDATESDAGLFFVPVIMTWARTKWPGALQDIPAEFDSQMRSTIALGDRCNGHHLPADIDDCHRVLMESYRTIGLLKGALSQFQVENQRLAALAEKYEQIRENNRLSAKRPRKGAW